MILKALYDYAQEENLAEGMDVTERLVHLVLTLNPDGSVLGDHPWQPLSRPVTNPKTGKTKDELGRSLKMPATPIVLAGGKAYFLADACEKVLGLNPKTGDPVPDDPGQGGNPSKGFQHFWQRIADAYEESKIPDLKTLLDFRDRYLTDEESRRSIPFVETPPPDSSAKPVLSAMTNDGPIPLESKTITFQIGALGGPVFQEHSPIHEYWKQAFSRERFAESSDDPETFLPNRGTCLVTGEENQPIADVHRTLIKGIRGLPPIGGYLVSFDRSTPSLTSFGFESGWNAPVSEPAALRYALGLNHLLANDLCRRSFGDAVLVSWVDLDPETTRDINKLLIEGIPSESSVQSFFKAFETGKDQLHLNTRFFHSMTLAANGGRIVLRRWLDTPLPKAVNALKRWFTDLEIEAIPVPRKSPKTAGRSRKRAPEPETPPTESPETSTAPPPLSMFALASTTARVPSEVPTSVYDALYRAALEESNPQALLAPVLHRLRIAATKSGNGIRFQTSRFALIKLILIRSPSQESFMETITPDLCETHDPAYNCGRLLALLDDIQKEAQGDVGADVVARFYGNASTFPRNVFPRLMRLEKHHRAKLLKSPIGRKQAAGKALGRKIDDVCGLFLSTAPGGAPDFPGLLSPQEQGRFALGFHQQKARNDRDRNEYFARKDEETKQADEASDSLAAEASESAAP